MRETGIHKRSAFRANLGEPCTFHLPHRDLHHLSQRPAQPTSTRNSI
jgi:hypothetical protein